MKRLYHLPVRVVGGQLVIANLFRGFRKTKARVLPPAATPAAAPSPTPAPSPMPAPAPAPASAPTAVLPPAVAPAPSKRLRAAERPVPSEPIESIAASDGWHLLNALAKRRGLRTLALRNLCQRLGVPLRRVSQKQVFVRPDDLDRALETLPDHGRAPSRIATPAVPRDVDDTLRDMLARRR